MTFHPISLADREVITAFTLGAPYSNCDFAFANMCSWRFLYDSEFAIDDGFLFIRFYIEEKGARRLSYMMPIGHGDLPEAIRKLDENNHVNGFDHPLLLLGITPPARQELEAACPDEFAYMADRDYFDYIYLREDLLTLRGKKLQSKRNHANRFRKEYAYSYLPLTAETAPCCMELERTWMRANATDDNADDLTNERRSMDFALRNFDALGLTGGALLIDGHIAAFTYGSPINADTFGVHVEKADTNYEGIFSVINQEFVAHIPEAYTYINREEDLGLPGLRRAKLSYNPAVLLEKFGAVKRR